MVVENSINSTLVDLGEGRESGIHVRQCHCGKGGISEIIIDHPFLFVWPVIGLFRRSYE